MRLHRINNFLQVSSSDETLPSDGQASTAQTQPQYTSYSGIASLAIRLRFAGFFSITLFVVLMASANTPLQLLDPVWQQKFYDNIIHYGLIPLMGLILIQLAKGLAWKMPSAFDRVSRSSQYSLIGMLIFLSLIPFQMITYINISNQWQTEVSSYQRKKDQYDRGLQAVQASESAIQLQAKLPSEFPRLNEELMNKQWPQLRAEYLLYLRDLNNRLEASRSSVLDAGPISTIKFFLHILSLLVMAFAYGIFARLPGSNRYLVDAIISRRAKPTSGLNSRF